MNEVERGDFTVRNKYHIYQNDQLFLSLSLSFFCPIKKRTGSSLAKKKKNAYELSDQSRLQIKYKEDKKKRFQKSHKVIAYENRYSI